MLLQLFSTKIIVVKRNKDMNRAFQMTLESLTDFHEISPRYIRVGNEKMNVVQVSIDGLLRKMVLHGMIRA